MQGSHKSRVLGSSIAAAAVYFVVAIAWFALLDPFAEWLTPDLATRQVAKGFVGLLFVVGNAVLLALIVRRELRRRQEGDIALRERDERFRVTADHAPVLIWMSGPDKKCVWFNRPWLEFVGRSLAEELGDGWAENVHAEDRPACLEQYNRAFDARLDFRLEYRLRRFDGVYRWILDHGTPLFREGQFEGYIGSCVDITDRKQLEDEHRRLAALVASSNESITSESLDGIITSWNDGARRLFGYTAAEAIGRPVQMLVPPEQLATFQALRAKVQNGEEVINQEVVRVGKNGDRIEAAVTLSRINDGQGKPIGYSRITRDLRATRDSQRILGDKETFIRAIVETSIEGIITIDQDGTVESLNPAAVRLFGYAPEEVIGQNVKRLMPQPYRDHHDSYLANYRQTGQAKIIGIGREVIGRRKDGSTFPMDLSVAQMAINGKHKFAGFVRDISERKQAEARMQQMLKELRDVKAALDEHSIVAITDASGRITHANEKFCQISKYPLEELIGRDHRIINSKFHPKEFFRDLWTTIGQGRVWRGEIKNRAKDGSYYWVDTTIYPFLDEAGKPLQYVAIRTDVTDRKASAERLNSLIQELADKNKELETLVYVTSHDLRSPLVNVQGFSDELLATCKELSQAMGEAGRAPGARERQLLDEIPEMLSFIQAGVLKMDRLLTGILRYSRLGRAALRTERIDMNRLLGEIAKSMDYQINAAGAVLHVGDLPAGMGDAVQISQVFSNLIDNAIKYRRMDLPCRIEVNGRAEHSKAVYSIQDNGIGIAPDHQAKAFEMFHRLNPGTGTGEGLGLAIAKKILERHNGSIRVESKAQAGSTFYVELPLGV
ncbi:MAG: PAS domain S-box protein [Verrucomicrobiota bacterium]